MITYPKLQSLSEHQMKGGGTCKHCGREFMYGETVSFLRIKLTPATDQTIITCNNCWFIYSKKKGWIHPMKTKEQLEKEVDSLQAKDYADTDAALPEWDYTHKDFLDKELTIVEVEETETQYGTGYIANTVYDGQVFRVLFGADVLVKRITRFKHELPVKVLVIKTGTYYDFA